MEAVKEMNLREIRNFFTGEIRTVAGKKIVGFIPYHSLSEDLGGGLREVILPGAFARSLSRSSNIVSLWSHDHKMPLGSTRGGTLKLSDTPKELNIELTPGSNTWGQDAPEAVRRGDVQGFSFGMIIVKDDFTDEPERDREIEPVCYPEGPDIGLNRADFQAPIGSQTKFTPEVYGQGGDE